MQVDHTLSLKRLSGIIDYQPAELVLTALPATPMAEIEAALAANRQMLAFEPPDWRHLQGSENETPTLGGVLACNISGSRRLQAGAARDHFLGYHGVNGFGEAYKSGAKVVKNVTGYDLTKLMAGSFGTLTAMTEVTVKVLPRPETCATLLVFGLEPDEAVRLLSDALNTPHEVTGAGYLPPEVAARSTVAAAQSVLALRVEGPEPSVRQRLEALRLHVAGSGETGMLDAEATVTLWREIGEARPFSADAAVIWRLSVPPTAAGDLVAMFRAMLQAEFLLDWGGGLIWLALETAGADGGAAIIRRAIAGKGGHASLIRAPETLRGGQAAYETLTGGLEALTARIKDSFDPKRVLNPGRLYPGM
jgi:glycolate oxidase FAD binding subunit